ncbi:hypothetical protein EII17_11365 [Clostridiales bacterium COT073_COT-073]|nr:hypothetical protein EII17_11365 [Clostridiales bacterium COT073_COT-073]
MRKQIYFNLLKTWLDALLKYQLSHENMPETDGALLCPACMVVHGRCHDAVYPLIYMAEQTGDPKYLKAAKKLFAWAEHLLCDNGGFYNDAQSQWQGITAFSAVALYDILRFHGHFIDAGWKAEIEERLRQNSEWVYQNIDLQSTININYLAAAAAVMAVSGKYFKREDYQCRAGELAQLCRQHFTEDALIFGEGSPRQEITPKGCRPVDIGYNVEETLPSLLLYAQTAGDQEVMAAVKESMHRHLAFMLPDGAWDNSMGSRSFKWTYWGSRTSDGCQAAYALCHEQAVFQEAADRNIELYQKCTHHGLLYGGPDYFVHGEKPCLHHSICHAKVLATVLNHGLPEFSGLKLPVETAKTVQYFKALDTYKIKKDQWYITFTGYDHPYMKGGHASGGAITMLWHPLTGPVMLSGMTEYQLREPHNMQLSRQSKMHQSLTFRLTYYQGQTEYSSCEDFSVRLTVAETPDQVSVKAEGELKNSHHDGLADPIRYQLDYQCYKDQIKINGRLLNVRQREVEVILPIIGRHTQAFIRQEKELIFDRVKARIRVFTDQQIAEPEPVFSLVPGFEAWKIKIKPDQTDEFAVTIKIQEIKKEGKTL